MMMIGILRQAPSLIVLLLFLAVGTSSTGLSDDFYSKSCPRTNQIVQRLVWKKVAGNPELAAKFLRLFFHDCFVRGCDASVLIDSTANNTAEKDAPPNKSLAGFHLIDRIKHEVEAACPGTVSCADIVALAARDSVSYQFQRNLWEVQLGRRDGTVSNASEALANIPPPSFNYSQLVNRFGSKGLNPKDLVVLSGGHTIGIAHCNFFSNRLYNFTGKGDTDPSLNPAYAAFLKTKCKNLSDNTTSVPMDPGSSEVFNSHYYVNLKKHQGLFQSDNALVTDARASALVARLEDRDVFFRKFMASIRRMGRIGVLTGSQGQIRKNCRVVNP